MVIDTYPESGASIRCHVLLTSFVWTVDFEQKAVYADYQALNQTPGVSHGEQMQPPEMATTVGVQDGKTESHP